MRVLPGTRDAVHAAIESFDRAVVYRSLQAHVIHALGGCLGTREIPPLGVSDVAEESGRRILM
jgi:hypothetical protein